MSTSVTGRVVDSSAEGIHGLTVLIRDESGLIGSNLGTGTTDGTGAYTVAIGANLLTDVPGARQIGVHVRTAGGRELYSHDYDDGTGDTLTIPDISLRTADAQGWAVSLPGTTNALPIRNGNALRPLIDDQVAWQHVSDAMRGAQKTISVMELELDMPREYNPAPPEEYPEIVLVFDSAFDPANPGPVLAADDYRPERVMLDAASHGTQVKVMIPKPDIGFVAIADFVILLVPMTIGALFAFRPAWTFWAGIWGQIFGSGPKGNAAAVGDYFAAAGSNAKALKFSTRTFSVVHAKTVLIDAVADAIDNAEAIVLGSPFSQSYWDTTAHEVYEPRRGSCAGEPIPVHDVSLGVRGPVVADLQQQFLAHWNRDCQPGDEVSALDPAPTELTAANAGEYLASVQLVRTVNDSTLPGLDNGERGVLEAYLRAIENATDYIYFENQYFTNDAIADALVAALKDTSRRNLQVILMVNVVPDMPFYPTWQTNLVERIRRDAGPGASRFGVFTSWSHTAAAPAHKHDNPVIMPDYLHTKTAVVDGKWATIGSGNLDGASLDQFQILRAIQFGNYRNDELNVIVFNGIENTPQTAFVDDLRLALWGEHLGLSTTAPELQASTLSASHGWLQLWTDRATAKLQSLISNPAVPDPAQGHILAYPPGAQSGFGLLMGWSHPHKNFLENAKIGQQAIDLTKIDLVEQTTAFSFHDGKWADA